MLSFSATVGDQGRVRAVTPPHPPPRFCQVVKGECPANFKTTKHRAMFVTSVDMRRWSKPLPMLESEVLACHRVPTSFLLLATGY